MLFWFLSRWAKSAFYFLTSTHCLIFFSIFYESMFYKFVNLDFRGCKSFLWIKTQEKNQFRCPNQENNWRLIDHNCLPLKNLLLFSFFQDNSCQFRSMMMQWRFFTKNQRLYLRLNLVNCLKLLYNMVYHYSWINETFASGVAKQHWQPAV